MKPLYALYYYQNTKPEESLRRLLSENLNSNLIFLNLNFESFPQDYRKLFFILPEEDVDLHLILRTGVSLFTLPSLSNLRNNSEARLEFAKTLEKELEETPEEAPKELSLSFEKVEFDKVILLLEKLKHKKVSLKIEKHNLTIGENGDIHYDELQYLIWILKMFGADIFSLVGKK